MTTTPRAALETVLTTQLEIEVLDWALYHPKFVTITVNKCLSALAPHLRTPGTVEVCERFGLNFCAHIAANAKYSECRYENCPIRAGRKP